MAQDGQPSEVSRGQFRFGFGLCVAANCIAAVNLSYACALFEYPPEGSTCDRGVDPIAWGSMLAAVVLPILSKRYAPSAFPVVCFVLLLWAGGIFGLGVSVQAG